MSMQKHRFSQHAIARWKERFSHLIRRTELDPIKSLCKEFYSAKPYRAILNNTAFIAKVYDNHGTEGGPIDFYTTDEVVFVCRENTLVTVYDREQNFPKLRKHNYKPKG